MKQLLAILLAFCLLGVFIGCSTVNETPFSTLTVEEVCSATVCISPPDRTFPVEYITRLVALLKEIRLFEKTTLHQELIGQQITFSLELLDGTRREIALRSPYIVIDGVGYKTADEPRDKLEAFADQLQNHGVRPILTEPPTLKVVVDGVAYPTSLGSYSWQKRSEGGLSEHVIADGVHPLDRKDMLHPLVEATTPTASLAFSEPPDTILEVRCWNTNDRESSSEKTEKTTLDGNELSLLSGGYIYEVVAQWDEINGYGGTAHYAFFIHKN